MVLVEYLVTDLILKYFYSFKVDFTSKSQHIVNLQSYNYITITPCKFITTIKS